MLFIGNSHTTHHDIPSTVASLLETLGTHQPFVATLQAGFLRMAMDRDDITAEIAEGNWDVVILQGHEISMSHSTRYSQAEVVELARLVREAGSRPLFFSEWKRQGVEETEYIEMLYQELAAKSGAEVIPVGRSWDEYLATGSARQLWDEDGNHSSAEGAFLAAAAIAHYLVGPGVEFEAPAPQRELLESAGRAIAEYLK